MARLKTVLLVGLGVLVCLGTTGVVLKGTAERNWSLLEQRLEEVEREVRARFESREPLIGQAGSGKALELYQEAIDQALEIVGLSAPRESLLELERGSPEDLDRRVEFAASVEPVLEALARGARAPDAKLFEDWAARDMDWQTGVALPILWPHEVGLVTDVAFQAALIHLVQGDSARALELLLSSLQLARDLGATPTLTEARSGALLLVREPLVALVAQGGWSRFARAELIAWSEALAEVDAQLDFPGDALRVHTLRNVRSFAEELAFGETPEYREEHPFLQHAVPAVTAVAKGHTRQSFEVLLDFDRDLRSAVRDGGGVLEVLDRYRAEISEQKALAQIPFEDLEQAVLLRAEHLARLRVLRFALGHHLDLENAPGVDRLGHPIRTATCEQGRRFWIEGSPWGSWEMIVPPE